MGDLSSRESLPMPDGVPLDNRDPLAATACPVCHAPVEAGQLPAHLRREHGLYDFQGVQRSYNDTLPVLLELLCSPVRPNARREQLTAWQFLRTIARETQGARADGFVLQMLSAYLARLPAEQRPLVLHDLGETMALCGEGLPLLASLLERGGTHAHALALALASSVTITPGSPHWEPLLGLLRDRELPEEVQAGAAASLLRPEGLGESEARHVLTAYLAGLGKTRSVERLWRLQALHAHPLVGEWRGRLEAKVKMRCPRCHVELRRPEMAAHLWQEHRLLLEGWKVREPWPLIEDWVARLPRHGAPEHIERLQQLVQHLDPEQGPLRLQQLLLRAGIADSATRQQLLEEAVQQEASVCPRCFALVPMPRPVPAWRLNRYRGRLSALGYRVEVEESGWRTRLELTTPRNLIYRGREPQHALTVKGATLLFAGPPVLLAVLVALGIVLRSVPPLWIVAPLLLFALAAGVMARKGSRPRRPLFERTLDYAWVELASRLHGGDFSLEDAAFLAGLALTTTEALGRGEVGLNAERTAALARIVRITENALTGSSVRDQPAVAEHLAALRRLLIEEAARRGEDPVPLVVAEIAQCFTGRLPVAYAEALLNDWRSAWWSRGNLARLRVLLCDRAFEAGLEVRHLVALGQSVGALGGVLGTHDAPGLAQLRLLWSLRPRCPWDRCGEAVNVFAFAEHANAEMLLGQFPDALLIAASEELAEPLDGKPSPLCIAVTGSGVALQGKLYRQKPAVIEIISKWRGMRGHELILGDDTYRFAVDPSEIAAELERWFRYLFDEFLPQTGAVFGWQSPDPEAILRVRGAVGCPGCRRPLLLRAGELARSLVEDRDYQSDAAG